ncbi:MAG: SGNH/GDSL hydrolase family protein [Ignavibacteriaceae bacterium]
MIRLKIFTILAIFILLAISGCYDYNKLNAPTAPSSGNADFSTFVSIGNSLTMGEQSGSVYESGQMYSFGNLIAQQLNVKYAQPLFSDPGTGGRIEITSLDPFTTKINPEAGVPVNLEYPAPYNNLGIKGAFLSDVLNAVDASTSYTAAFGSPNPLFDAVLRGLGTQLQQAMFLKPTLVTLWIGNNDILAYATRGGLFPITPLDAFNSNFNSILEALKSTGADVVAGNIPNVTAIPFFTTVGPGVGLAIQAAMNSNPDIVGLVYELSVSPGIGVATPDNLFSGDVLITLSASSAATLIGDVTGAYYTQNNIPVPPTVNTAFPFGLTPENPFPNGLLLDPVEIGNVAATISAYNSAIETAVASYGFAMVDINSVFNDIAVNGRVENGITFTTQYVEGNLFSLDGVHPTSQGYGIVANEFIKTMNAAFNSNIPLVDISTIPGSLPLGKVVTLGKYGIPIIPNGALDNVLF